MRPRSLVSGMASPNLALSLITGAAALAHFATVVIDEVHERSCENDLGLACLVQLAASAKELRSLRIVLMSATADVRRYSEFMRPLCEQGQLPGKVALGESAVV